MCEFTELSSLLCDLSAFHYSNTPRSNDGRWECSHKHVQCWTIVRGVVKQDSHTHSQFYGSAASYACAFSALSLQNSTSGCSKWITCCFFFNFWVRIFQNETHDHFVYSNSIIDQQWECPFKSKILKFNLCWCDAKPIYLCRSKIVYQSSLCLRYCKDTSLIRCIHGSCNCGQYSHPARAKVHQTTINGQNYIHLT